MTPQTVRLYGAAIASAKIGTGFFFLINTWLIIEITGHPSSAAITLVMTILPSLLLSPLIGLAVDRSEPAQLAWRAEVFRWLVLMSYGLLYAAGYATAPIAYLVSFLIALGNEIQVLAWRAALARHASSEQMFRLNALTVVTGQTGQILGAAASGVVLAAIGAAATVGVASTTYLLSALAGFVVARRMHGTSTTEPSPNAPERGVRRHLNDLRDGLRHIAQRPAIAFFYGLILANLTVIFGINAMLAPFVREELHLGAAAFGKIDAGYALGAIVSGFFVVRLANRFGRRTILTLAFLVAALSLLVFAQCSGLVVAFVTYVGLGASFQSSVIALSAAQRAADPLYQGRVSASFNVLNGLAGLAIYGIVAMSAGHHLYRQLYLWQAAIMLIMVPVVVLASRREGISRLLKPEALAPAPARERAAEHRETTPSRSAPETIET
ncbi:MFS transporter [Paraburkholderia megapolitana]|uniref:Major Facilitator Superfamily protein n=1 Tax=Paraburkholderia megapolitana TaxID=420953 RepID=A0A1I3FQL8_9BURK|nr:MFS transporter [Paraburkholderia megapolitana]SFI13392.1 Major Facilitator Superfamily protein [Paraburkholderia megapolitana]